MTNNEAGRLGGLATRDKYGKAHYQKIGKLGAAVMWSRWRIMPAAFSGFILVNRQNPDDYRFFQGHIPGYKPQ